MRVERARARRPSSRVERRERRRAADRVRGEGVAVEEGARAVAREEGLEERLGRERRGERQHAAGQALREAQEVGRDRPRCSHANRAPVRPKPVITSSAISGTPCASHARAHGAQERRGACMRMPPAPWTSGSTITRRARARAELVERARRPRRALDRRRGAPRTERRERRGRTGSGSPTPSRRRCRRGSRPRARRRRVRCGSPRVDQRCSAILSATSTAVEPSSE